MKKWELFVRPEFEEVAKEAVRRLGKENDILISSTLFLDNSKVALLVDMEKSITYDLPFELGEGVI